MTSPTPNTPAEVLAMAQDALEANHQWHKDHDDHDGYPGSDLEAQNVAALEALRAMPAPTTVSAPMALDKDFEEVAAVIDRHVGKELFVEPGDLGAIFNFAQQLVREVRAYRTATLADQPARGEAPDGAHEALQRMIEDGLTRGPASREDARLVARYRRPLLTQRAGRLAEHQWSAILLAVNDYAMQVNDAANHEAASKADIAQSSALAALARLRKAIEAVLPDQQTAHAKDEWRRLALQFDAHRMQALAHLRTLLAEPVSHAEAARAFLAEPPPRTGDVAALPGWESASAVGDLLLAIGQWKASTPETAPAAWDALVRACAGMLAAATAPQAPEPKGEAYAPDLIHAARSTLTAMHAVLSHFGLRRLGNSTLADSEVRCTGHLAAQTLTAALKHARPAEPVTLEMIRALPTVTAPEFDGELSDGTPRRWDRRPYVSRTALEALLSEHGALPWRLPKEPPPGLLMSMAMRYDHALGLPGYYDTVASMLKDAGMQPAPSHSQRLEATLRTMRQLYEEVSGHGFYSPEREADYRATAQGEKPFAGEGD